MLLNLVHRCWVFVSPITLSPFPDVRLMWGQFHTLRPFLVELCPKGFSPINFPAFTNYIYLLPFTFRSTVPSCSFFYRYFRDTYSSELPAWIPFVTWLHDYCSLILSSPNSFSRINNYVFLYTFYWSALEQPSQVHI